MPMGRVYASQYELLTLRGAHVPEGQEDPSERHIIQILLMKAQAVGYVVPEVVTTKIQPLWSRMPNPPRGALNTMRRVAGLNGQHPAAGYCPGCSLSFGLACEAGSIASAPGDEGEAESPVARAKTS